MTVARQHDTNRGLEVLRGVAALLVVLGHTRFHLLTALDLPTTGSGPVQHLLLLPTLFAKEAVAVFFVLSGYLVGGQVLRQVLRRDFSWRSYLGKRTSRLWTVLVPGIAVTLIVDALDQQFFPRTLARLQDTVDLDAWTGVCNVLFLQESRCRRYGSNESLWSLGYEFWFYVLFAGLVVGLVGLLRRSPRRAALGLAVALASVGLFGTDLLWFFPSWLAGAAVAVLHDRWRRRGAPPWVPLGGWAVHACLLATLGAMVITNRLVDDDPLRFVVVALPAAPLVLLLAVRDRLPVGGAGDRLASVGDWIGRRSFSVYVFHLPLVKLAVGAAAASGPWSSWAGVAGVYLLSVAAVSVCSLLYLATERHTPRVRDALLRALGVGRPEAADQLRR